jgi:hypothetical protein
MVIMPRVATKGGTLALVMVNPFINPQDAPTPNPTNIAAGIGIPDCNIEAAITDERASIEPTDRSIPAVRITSVIPTAMMPFIVDCLKMLIKLSTVRKRSERIDRARQSNKNENINP